jgi:hypothetical protein
MCHPLPDPELCTVGFDFKPFLPNGFFERVVNRQVSDWPAGYMEIDPQISWNTAELCVSSPQYRVQLIVDKEAHTISAIVGNEHAKLIIPHVKDVADKVNKEFYASRIIFACSGDAEGGPERPFRKNLGSQDSSASAVSSSVRLETDPDFRALRAFFEKCGVASDDAIEYAKAGRGETEASGETVASLRRIHAGWTKSWNPHLWHDGGEAGFRKELAEYFGVAGESSLKAKRNQNSIINRLAGMDQPPEIRDFLIGYFGGDNLPHAQCERKQITRALMRENLRAELSDLVSVQNLNSGLIDLCKPSASYRVLHLAVHGHQLTRAGKHTLAFRDDQPPEPELLAEVIASSCIHDDGDVKRGCISCVFINACFGSDIGERLTSDEHVPWVVTWTTMVDDEAAQTFAEEFYAALSKTPSDFCIAFERAKTSLRLRNWVIDDDGGDPGLEERQLHRQNGFALEPRAQSGFGHQAQEVRTWLWLKSTTIF